MKPYQISSEMKRKMYMQHLIMREREREREREISTERGILSSPLYMYIKHNVIPHIKLLFKLGR